jgi:uncharacterized membrane protein HdeD (DUF308 family)
MTEIFLGEETVRLLADVSDKKEVEWWWWLIIGILVILSGLFTGLDKGILK